MLSVEPIRRWDAWARQATASNFSQRTHFRLCCPIPPIFRPITGCRTRAHVRFCVFGMGTLCFWLKNSCTHVPRFYAKNKDFEKVGCDYFGLFCRARDGRGSFLRGSPYGGQRGRAGGNFFGGKSVSVRSICGDINYIIIVR